MIMQKGQIGVWIIVGILVMTVVGGAYYFTQVKPQSGNQACTQEAKVCPDGSTVGRVGLTCEFAKCPGKGKDDRQVCIQVITSAKNFITGECKEFPTPCDVPEEWERVESCNGKDNSADNYERFSISCQNDTDCQIYILPGICEVECGNKAEENKSVVKMKNANKTCNPELWEPPSVECKCIKNQCTKRFIE